MPEFEGLKEKGAMVIVPSSAVDTMNLGGIAGLTALAESSDGGLAGGLTTTRGDKEQSES